jgi:hypothetical protein
LHKWDKFWGIFGACLVARFRWLLSWGSFIWGMALVSAGYIGIFFQRIGSTSGDLHFAIISGDTQVVLGRFK